MLESRILQYRAVVVQAANVGFLLPLGCLDKLIYITSYIEQWVIICIGNRLGLMSQMQSQVNGLY